MLCTDGPSEIDADESRAARAQRHRRREERVVRARGHATASCSGSCSTTGSRSTRRALFFTTGQYQRSDLLLAALGCEFNDKGTVRTGKYETTHLPGLFVAGDASRAVQWVSRRRRRRRGSRVRHQHRSAERRPEPVVSFESATSGAQSRAVGGASSGSAKRSRASGSMNTPAFGDVRAPAFPLEHAAQQLDGGVPFRGATAAWTWVSGPIRARGDGRRPTSSPLPAASNEMPGIQSCSALITSSRGPSGGAFSICSRPSSGFELEEEQAAQPQRHAHLEPRRLGLHFRFRLRAVFAGCERRNHRRPMELILARWY